MATFKTIEQMVARLAEGIRPPRRISVSNAAEEYRTINNPGVFVGTWSNEKAPYLVEPMNALSSLSYTGMIFVGPAQSGKTEMLPNWLLYSAMCDPADMMMVHMTKMSARDFFLRRLDRFYRDNPNVAERILPGKHNRSSITTRFESGMMFSMSWPSITELSGKPVPRLWLTDYDRMPSDIGGEGSPYSLAKKRATTFKQFGMTVAESSPGFEIDDPRWLATTPHEAPPTQGILSLYNGGDRRRWYWPCPYCLTAFEPTFDLLQFNPRASDFMSAAEAAVMACPHCGGVIWHDGENDSVGKDGLNKRGRWLRDGETWQPAIDGVGVVAGTPRRSDTASFWLMGVAAAFTDWRGLVYNYLKAQDEFIKTGSQEALKVTVNTDQGMPYLPRGSEISRLPEDLKERVGGYPLGVVPEGVRFLVATIDVQKNRFIVQVHGFGEGRDMWVIDRFEVKLSKRIDPSTKEHFWLSPGSYLEDWNELIPAVLNKDYPLWGDKQKRLMRVKIIGCDSGGREGVTTNAYNFWRFLRDGPDVGQEAPEGYQEGLHRRFQLLKGDPKLSIPRVQIIFPDSQRKDRNAGARGEIPILLINSNVVKDQLNAMLDRTEPGGGRVTFPDGLSDSFYAELIAEKKTAKGWENLKRLRNEAWDLAYYAIALSISKFCRIEQIDWTKPPSWAAPWDENSLVYSPLPEGARPFAESVKQALDMKQVASALL